MCKCVHRNTVLQETKKSPREPKKLYRAGSLEEGKSGWENWRDQAFWGIAFRMTTKCQMPPAMFCTYLSHSSYRLPKKTTYNQGSTHSHKKLTQQPKILHLVWKKTHSTFDWTFRGGGCSSCPRHGEWQLQHTQHRLSPPLASPWRDLEGVNPWSRVGCLLMALSTSPTAPGSRWAGWGGLFWFLHSIYLL